MPVAICCEIWGINQVLEFYKIKAENKDSCLKYLKQNLYVLLMFPSDQGEKCC